MIKSILFFDIESTGLEITKDRIIQLSLIKTDLNLNVIEKKKLYLSNCGVPIHPKAFEAHGISEQTLIDYWKKERIEDVPTFSNYAIKIYQFIDGCYFICGYNIKKFDIPLLHEEFARCGINWIPKPIIDSLIIFHRKEPRTLSAAVKFYCGRIMENAHDSEFDVLATIDVLKGQIDMYGFVPISELESDFGIPDERNLLLESKFDNEDERLSWDGRILVNSEGIAVWGFGKWKDKPVKEADLGYINWFLASDFPTQTKNVLKFILAN